MAFLAALVAIAQAANAAGWIAAFLDYLTKMSSRLGSEGEKTAGSESNRQDKHAGLSSCPLIISWHPAEDGKIIPLHGGNAIFVRSGIRPKKMGGVPLLLSGRSMSQWKT